MGPSQGIGVSRRSDNTNGLSCSSACCLYLGGPRDATACDESNSTACSNLPRHARRTLWTSALNCAHTAVDMFNKNDIYEWCRDHRVHHKFTETDADPHNIKRGFFFAHIGWLMCKKHPYVAKKGKTVFLEDLLADPIVRFQRR
ncbi:Stearoyl-CoA desaturase 5 [Araneus ventricosus]|uniref:Stearoyl-CoA desaturase 5 n=1 Tax=Araneus ventricosus TaxID=182803 RepID=A0A4Y2MS29_ARAVE|nr:Stearoyl-CoA desaturase 5 [Araneus ventricosus]